jgi:Arc/MetJ-type ribon-helix-helix transcriptional regulator
MARDGVQVNVRVPSDYAKQIDQKRIELQASLGHIPTRSEIVRLALDEFLAKGTERKARK